MRGTLINAGAVAAGALVGWSIRAHIPLPMKDVVLGGLGLVTLGIGVKLFLESKRIVVVAGAIALGGAVGYLLGIAPAFASLSEWARQHLGGGERFNEALITASILYCVGPMTLLGCLQDGIEGRYELLAIKSMMDGIGAVFFAATIDPLGLLATALVVLIFQGALTLGARRLQRFAEDDEMVAEISATGGVMLLAIGLGLLDIRKISPETYLPALVLAPVIVWASRRWVGRRRLTT